MKRRNNLIRNNISEQKENSKLESNNENDINKNLSKNDLMNTKNKADKNSKDIIINNNNINSFGSRNLSPLIDLKDENTQSQGTNTINDNSNIKTPMLVINDKAVQIKDDDEEINDFHNKTSYENFIKYITHNRCKKMNNLANNNELKNIISFGDFSEKIEKKLKLKLIKKTKNLILRKYKTKNFEKNTEKLLDNNSYNFQITPYNNGSQSLTGLNNNMDKKINEFMQIKKRTIKLERNYNNKLFNKQNQLLDKRINLDSKNITFNYAKKEFNSTKNLFFKNNRLKKNLSGFPFLKETAKENNKINNNFEKDIIRTKLYHLKDLRKNKYKYLQTPKSPKSFMSSFNIFKRKMEKLNIILK